MGAQKIDQNPADRLPDLSLSRQPLFERKEVHSDPDSHIGRNEKTGCYQPWRDVS